MQMLNIAFGGSLYQDLAQFPLKHFKHRQKCQTYTASHTVEFVANTRLHNIMGVDITKINTFHHQAVKEPAPGFIINARAKDGIIEGIEKPGDSFILGLQWHPEMMLEKDPSMLKIFSEFAAFAKSHRD